MQVFSLNHTLTHVAVPVRPIDYSVYLLTALHFPLPWTRPSPHPPSLSDFNVLKKKFFSRPVYIFDFVSQTGQKESGPDPIFTGNWSKLNLKLVEEAHRGSDSVFYRLI